MRFPDVADGLETDPQKVERKSSIDSLKVQVPWSYITATSSTSDVRNGEDRTFTLSDSVSKIKRKAIYSGSGDGFTS